MSEREKACLAYYEVVADDRNRIRRGLGDYYFVVTTADSGHEHRADDNKRPNESWTTD
jgi:hypothetical protein